MQFWTYARSAVSKPAACVRASSRRVERGVDRAVEHETPDPLGEQLGVRRAELVPYDAP
jgi:hypothetical protein